jgi:cell fate regulator YaaT (PSP1 superfamily)
MMPHSAPSEGEAPSPPAPASPEEPQDLTESRPPEHPPTSAEDGGEGKAAAEAKPPPRPSVVARYGLMGNIGEFRHNLDPPPGRGANVVLRTERGVELGQVVTPVGEAGGHDCISRERLREFTGTNGPDYPFRRDGRVLRLANPQDVIDYRHLQQSAREAAGFCRQQIREISLEMRLVTVEHLLGGERLVFYFAAEQRVDFRELVRRLAGQYRTRIEMRQVGARDEARLVGDYERCGQQCCCQRFLKYLKPVSMRMAKTQKATLDPSKISGRCGRLMCCLRYEDETYEDLRKKLPRKNTWVATKELVGRVIEGQILTQLVRVQLPDNSRTVVAVEDIVERDVEPPSKPEMRPEMASTPAPAAAPAPADRERAPEADRKQAAAEAAPAGPSERSAGQEGEPAPARKRRRRRRPRRKQAEGQGKAAQPAEREPAKASGGGEGDLRGKAPPKRRSGRRRGGRGKRRRQK